MELMRQLRGATITSSIVCSLLASNYMTGAELYDDLGESDVVGLRQGADWVLAPFSVQSITSEDYSARLSRNLIESLERVAGVMVQKTANGQGSPYIRGFTGYRTLALIDGVRYNNSVYRDGPNEYFSLIDLYTVDRMDVVQGPASVIYGSDAIGGTLNLVTNDSGIDNYSGLYQHGSVGMRYSSGEQSTIGRFEYMLGEGGEWGLRFGLTRKELGDVRAANLGELTNTGYDEAAFDVRYDRRLNDRWSMTAVYQNLVQDDVWRTHSTIYSKSFAGTSVGSDLRRLKDQRRSLSYLKFSGEELQTFTDKATLTISYQTWDENGDRIRSSGNRAIDYFDSRMWGIDFQFEKDLGNVRIVFGVDSYKDSIRSGRVDYKNDGSIEQVRVQGPIGDNASFIQSGAYIQGEWGISDQLSLVVGSRVSHIRSKIGSYEDPVSGLATSYSDEWTTLVNSVKLRYALNRAETINVWGGISQSFRAPNIADVSRYGGSRSSELEVAATGLDPEKFLSFEVGIKAEESNYTFAASYYYTTIDDYITTTPTGRTVNGLTEVSKRNSADGYVHGITLEGRYFLSDEWKVWANLTWTEGELNVYSDVSSGTTGREPLSRLMPLTVNTGAEWKRNDGQLWFGVDFQWAAKADRLSTGDMLDAQRIPPGGTPSYKRINFYGGYKIADHWQVNGVIQNILDEAYRVHGSGSNEPGLGLTVGVKYSF